MCSFAQCKDPAHDLDRENGLYQKGWSAARDAYQDAYGDAVREAAKDLDPTGVCNWCGEECSNAFCRPECYRSYLGAEVKRPTGENACAKVDTLMIRVLMFLREAQDFFRLATADERADAAASLVDEVIASAEDEYQRGWNAARRTDSATKVGGGT